MSFVVVYCIKWIFTCWF